MRFLDTSQRNIQGQELRYFRYLSVDICIGAVAMAYYLARTFFVKAPLLEYVILFLTVWIIYTLDHLLDIRNNQSNYLSPRHAFHKKHFRVISRTWIALLLLQVFLLFFLNLATLFLGISLTAFVVVYYFILFFKREYLRIQKEVVIAVLYTCGIFIPVVSAVRHVTWGLVLCFVFIVLLALHNLWLISAYEKELDIQNNYPSAATSWNSSTLNRAINIIIGLETMIIFLFVITEVEWTTILLFVSMMTALAFITAFRFYFARYERYRIMADGVFLFPIISFVPHDVNW